MEAASAHVPRGRDLQPDPVAPDRARPRLPARAARPARLVSRRSSRRPRERHSVESIPGLLAQAWRIALTPPSGPVYLEIPVDLLRAPAPGGAGRRHSRRWSSASARRCEQVTAAATRLAHARRPVIWAGGGVLRSARHARAARAGRAPPGPGGDDIHGQGRDRRRPPARRRLRLRRGRAPGAALDRRRGAVRRHRARRRDDRPVRAALRRAGHPSRRRPRRASASTTAPCPSSATPSSRCWRSSPSSPTSIPSRPGPSRRARVSAVQERIRSGLESQGREMELGLLQTHREGAPARCRHGLGHDHPRLLGGPAPAPRPAASSSCTRWDRGRSAMPGRPRSARASRTPSARCSAVIGDGGLQYTIAELGTAAQHDIAAKLLVVDDGGYGILREYQRDALRPDHLGRAARQEPGGDRRRLRRAGAHRRARDLGEQLRVGAGRSPGPRWSCCASSSPRRSRRHEPEVAAAPLGRRRRPLRPGGQRGRGQGAAGARRPDPPQLEREPVRTVAGGARRSGGRSSTPSGPTRRRPTRSCASPSRAGAARILRRSSPGTASRR